MTNSEPAHNPHEKPEHGHTVIVLVDRVEKRVRPGRYIVSDFKKEVGVDESKDLDQVIHGEIKPLKDTDHIIIKGGEVFISHVRSGSSS